MSIARSQNAAWFAAFGAIQAPPELLDREPVRRNPPALASLDVTTTTGRTGRNALTA